MIENKVLTIADFMLFQERMRDFALFEFIDHQIIPVQGTEPVEDSLIAYVLSAEFDENEITTSFPMATKNHDTIISNLHGYLFIMLKQLGIKVYSQGTDIYAPGKDKAYKPDIVLVKKGLEKRENHQIINPLVTFEVLSKSTQAKDKTEKLEGYQGIESLQAYVLIAQDAYKVTVYERLSANTWQQQNLNSLEDTLSIKSLDIQMNLKEIYEEVEF